MLLRRTWIRTWTWTWTWLLIGRLMLIPICVCACVRFFLLFPFFAPLDVCAAFGLRCGNSDSFLVPVLVPWSPRCFISSSHRVCQRFGRAAGNTPPLPHLPFARHVPFLRDSLLDFLCCSCVCSLSCSLFCSSWLLVSMFVPVVTLDVTRFDVVLLLLFSVPRIMRFVAPAAALPDPRQHFSPLY